MLMGGFWGSMGFNKLGYESISLSLSSTIIFPFRLRHGEVLREQYNKSKYIGTKE